MEDLSVLVLFLLLGAIVTGMLLYAKGDDSWLEFCHQIWRCLSLIAWGAVVRLVGGVALMVGGVGYLIVIVPKVMNNLDWVYADTAHFLGTGIALAGAALFAVLGFSMLSSLFTKD
ncbi:MAG TPA: hypothetical protein VEA59_05030 [Patescibacteria group bacterium]|nr:hypothetical protein [Patescibacteria group bacterium]